MCLLKLSPERVIEGHYVDTDEVVAAVPGTKESKEEDTFKEITVTEIKDVSEDRFVLDLPAFDEVVTAPAFGGGSFNSGSKLGQKSGVRKEQGPNGDVQLRDGQIAAMKEVIATC